MPKGTSCAERGGRATTGMLFKRPEPILDREEVEATMRLIADVRNDGRRIRRVLENDDAEEETEPDS